LHAAYAFVGIDQNNTVLSLMAGTGRACIDTPGIFTVHAELWNELAPDGRIGADLSIDDKTPKYVRSRTIRDLASDRASMATDTLSPVNHHSVSHDDSAPYAL
jgi:hypothetical protein